MSNRRKRIISDDDIAELYRGSLLNPNRITMRLWDGIDYVISRRLVLNLALVLIGSALVLIIGWAIRWPTNAASPSPTPVTSKSR